MIEYDKEGSYVPAGGTFGTMITELQKSDKETYDLWHQNRERDNDLKFLKEDHPDNLKVLQKLLEEAIAKKGWTILPPTESSNGEIIVIKKGWIVSNGLPYKDKTMALLSAYL